MHLQVPSVTWRKWGKYKEAHSSTHRPTVSAGSPTQTRCSLVLGVQSREASQPPSPDMRIRGSPKALPGVKLFILSKIPHSSHLLWALTVGITLGAPWHPNSVFVGLSLSCYLFQGKAQPPTAKVHVEQGTFSGRNPNLWQSSSWPRGASLEWKMCLWVRESTFLRHGEELYQPFFRGKGSIN